MDATPQSSTRRTPRVVTWVLRLARPGRAWSASRIDTLGDAEKVIAGAEVRERQDGTRMEVEIVRSDGSRVVASARVCRGGRWVDAEAAASAETASS